ncbi:MAG: flagellar hook-basal body complex protein, partial [Deltaproteobacteria bacterium]
AYEYQTTVKVYDSLGSTHDITIYYDKGSGSTYEYIVVCNPDEDNRQGLGLVSTDAGLGMLGSGTITFNEASGAIQDITFSRFIGEAGGLSKTTDFDAGATDPVATVYGEYTGTGTLPKVYTFTATSTGVIGADTITLTQSNNRDASTATVTIPSDYTAGTILGSSAGILDGIQFSFDSVGGNIVTADDMTFTVTAGDAGDLSDTDCWANMTTTNDLSSDGYFEFNADFLGGTNSGMDVGLDFGSSYSTAGGSWVNDSLSTTQYSAASSTIFQSANGYGAGDLQSVNVGTDGAITGQYSNGQVIPLFRVALAKFQNNQGLFKVGGNLFRETRLSGQSITGKPGTGGLGSIAPNSLEQSNVDIAAEFVKMITTQRGFQANSKIITVTDQMLAELMNLKR